MSPRKKHKASTCCHVCRVTVCTQRCNVQLVECAKLKVKCPECPRYKPAIAVRKKDQHRKERP